MSSSSRHLEEVTSSDSNEVQENVNKRVKYGSDVLSHKTKRLRGLKTLDESAKMPKNVLFPKMVKLNIGGHLFSTSLETLTKDPGSMLHVMFSGRFDTNFSEDESYFIDRDGTHFRYILNYLRTGQLIVPEDEIVREELLAEAEFYQVEGMVKALTPTAFKDSVILSSEQRQILENWLKETRNFTNTNLLYRASRDGWYAFNFHSRCDNKGPTVTVVKSGNYIFGGYTEQRWEALKGTRASYIKAPASFLFSLVNPSGLPPAKMPLIAGKEGYAIWCASSYGPVFGSGCDLCIVNAPNSNCKCHSNLNSSYQCPAGQDAEKFLTGEKLFTVSEIEVFGFEK